jgi:PHD/YefM family antitoxin component YafN of YafNO toxin-antitoxin module
MKNKRTFIEEDDDCVTFTSINDGRVYICTKHEWEKYLLMEELVDSGANEDKLNALCDLTRLITWDSAGDD